jgi:fumarate hydratase class II
MHIAACLHIERITIPKIKKLRNAFRNKSKEFNDIVKIGRTHMQDATPITF